MGGKPRRGARQRVGPLLAGLDQAWGHATCELDHRNAYELTVATILSAQSTDELVNKVTPVLFASYPDARALAGADQSDVERLVHSTGFFRQKSKNLIAMARTVVADFGGDIPRTMDEMTKLPGVARKTANVVLGTAYGIASGIVVDTHVKRLSDRLGMTNETDPVAIERDLIELIPRDRWVDFGHQLIWHGRRVCAAKKPACDRCSLAPICPSFPLDSG